MSPCNLHGTDETKEGPNWDGEPGAVEQCLWFTALSPIMKADVVKSMSIPLFKSFDAQVASKKISSIFPIVLTFATFI